MNGLTRQELLQYLTNNGFNPTGKPSPKGWQTFRHEDRSLVFVNWVEKRIVRNEAPIYGSDGAKVNNGQRLDPNGNRIPRSLDHSLHPKETFVD